MTVTEIAQLKIKPGAEQAFEADLTQAAGLVKAAPGCIDALLRRSIDAPGSYIFHVEWQTRDDHTVRFAASADFATFQNTLAPYLEEPPVVEHFELV